MRNFVEFAIIGAGIAMSLGVALVLEWLSLRGLMRLMPVSPTRVTVRPDREEKL